MSTCVIPGCPGGHVKYPNCLIEALWVLGEDYAVASGGNSNEGPGFHMLFIFDEAVWMSDLEKHWCRDFGIPDFQVSGGTCVLITEHPSGEIGYLYFTSGFDAHCAFDAAIAKYESWSDIHEY